MASEDRGSRSGERGERWRGGWDASGELVDQFAAGTQPQPRSTLDDAAYELASIPAPAFAIDAEHAIVDANPTAEAFAGYLRDELVGRRVETVIDELPLEPARVRFLPSATIHHRNGTAMPVELLVCPHGCSSWIAIVRASHAGDSPGLAFDEVAQIVHDFKGPLSTIALEASLLDGRAGGPDRQLTQEAVTRMIRNVEFLDRMVQDLLDLCAIDGGRFVIHRRPTNLSALLEHTVERVVPSRDRWRVFLQLTEQIELAIDDLRIERVAANLLHNALTHASARSGIVVRLDALGDRARVAVIDAGPGIDPAESGTIFEPYRRGSAAARGGTGLGLYVSKRTVEAHGGRIGVDTIASVGSQFYFELPLA